MEVQVDYKDELGVNVHDLKQQDFNNLCIEAINFYRTTEGEFYKAKVTIGNLEITFFA